MSDALVSGMFFYGIVLRNCDGHIRRVFRESKKSGKCPFFAFAFVPGPCILLEKRV